MKPLFQAIYNEYNSTALDTALSDQFYLGKADQGISMPYVVYKLISNTPEYTFDSRVIERARVQFSIYSDSNSASEVTDLYTTLKAVFDDCSLTVSGYTFLKMERVNAILIPDLENGLWHYAVDYIIELQEV